MAPVAEPRNPQQSVADAVVRSVRERRRLVELTSLGLATPEKLAVEDIQSICRFVTAHAEYWHIGKNG